MMATRDNIIQELLTGETPYQLSKKYPRASVYRIYNELLQADQLPKGGFVPAEINEDEEDTPDLGTGQPPSSTTSAVKAKTKVSGQVGAEIVSFPGDTSFPADAVNRIRGILGITLRPKVLSCPMPELLYPAMVIAVNDFGFPPMRPDDFIDTVLYQWLEACDIIPFAYMKKSEAEEFAKGYGMSENYTKEYIEQHGLMSEEQFAEKHGIILPTALHEEEEEDKTDDEGEDETESEASTSEVPAGEGVINGEYKLTVGDLLGDLISKLHISNIKEQEVIGNGSAARHTEPDSTQGGGETGE